MPPGCSSSLRGNLPPVFTDHTTLVKMDLTMPTKPLLVRWSWKQVFFEVKNWPAVKNSPALSESLTVGTEKLHLI